MATFSSEEEVYDVMGAFFEQVTKDPELGPKFQSAKTAFRINYTDPDAALLIDTTQDPIAVRTGEAASNSDVEVELTMTADDGHKFWLGDLNIPMAMARRKVKVDGPVGKLMGLLPAMQPAFGKYKTYLDERGLTDKLA